jgi:hypothetical protein
MFAICINRLSVNKPGVYLDRLMHCRLESVYVLSECTYEITGQVTSICALFPSRCISSHDNTPTLWAGRSVGKMRQRRAKTCDSVAVAVCRRLQRFRRGRRGVVDASWWSRWVSASGTIEELASMKLNVEWILFVKRGTSQLPWVMTGKASFWLSEN